MAFERAFGPIGPEWRDEALAAVHDQLQILGAALGVKGEPRPLKRPTDWADKLSGRYDERPPPTFTDDEDD